MAEEFEKEEYKSEHDDYVDDPEEHEASEDEVKAKIKSGEKEEDVYTSEGREEMREEDELDDWEEGYVEGAEGKHRKKKKQEKL